MIRKYLTETEFENLDGLYNSNIDYIVVDEDSIPKKVVLKTNNLTGETITFDVEDEYPTPTGTINITENGENIDVKQYATANVNVPAPINGYIFGCIYSITDGSMQGMRYEPDIADTSVWAGNNDIKFIFGEVLEPHATTFKHRKKGSSIWNNLATVAPFTISTEGGQTMCLYQFTAAFNGYSSQDEIQIGYVKDNVTIPFKCLLYEG